MQIRFVSALVDFLTGSAAVLKVDWGRSAESVLVHGKCRDNVIHGLDIVVPGTYMLWISEAAVRCGATGKVWSAGLTLVPWHVTIQSSDQTEAVLHVPRDADGVFELTLLDSEGKAVTNGTLTIGSDTSTGELHLDSLGKAIVIGNPTQCCMEVETGNRVVIDRLV